MNRFLVFILLAFISCDLSEHPGYTEYAPDLHYQRLRLGEGISYHPDSCFVDYTVIYFPLDNPSIKKRNKIKFSQFQGVDHIDSLFINSKKGVVLNLIVSENNSLSKNLCKDESLFDSIAYQIEIKIDEVYNLFIQEEDPNVIEYRSIQRYLSYNSAKGQYKYYNGIWMKWIEKNDKDTVSIAGEIVLDYAGYSLDDKVLDIPDYPLKFNTKDQYQVIEGIEISMRKMTFGDSVVVIIPSYLAFGELGSKSGNVPPYKALIYRLKIYKAEAYKAIEERKVAPIK